MPRLAVIGGAKYIRTEVIAAVSIEAGISRARSRLRHRDTADPGTFGKAGNSSGNVLPALSAITCDLQIAIIGANPQNVCINRRLTDHRDSRIPGDPVVQ